MCIRDVYLFAKFYSRDNPEIVNSRYLNFQKLKFYKMLIQNFRIITSSPPYKKFRPETLNSLQARLGALLLHL